MKRFKRAAVLLVSAMLLLWAAGALALCSARRLPVTTPDLADLSDGCYTGKATVLPVHIWVEVDVQDHRMVSLRILEHACGLGQPAEALVQTVLERQSLDLDAVSGATVSSKCLLKAIENALAEGEIS